MTRELLISGIRATFDLAGQDTRGLDALPVVDLRYLAERCRDWHMQARVAGILGRAVAAARPVQESHGGEAIQAVLGTGSPYDRLTGDDPGQNRQPLLARDGFVGGAAIPRIDVRVEKSLKSAQLVETPRTLPREPLPAQDALDLIDEYHAGTRTFVSTEVGLIELGCSQAVMQAFIAEAFENARR